MSPLKSSRFLLSLIVIAASIVTPVAQTTAFVRHQQKTAQSRQTSAQTDFQARLARMGRMLEDKRKELGVPGMSVAVVKDDKIVFSKGFGVRNAEKNLPVTIETLFPIGSSTKAFTGMLMAMSVDDGKIAFADSPKKYLSYFKLQDPEADKKITVRDLMIHDSGLARTELIWYPGVLNRREVIRAAGEAKPTARFGERFQYQNVMVSAAGEAVAQAQNSTWETLMNERILKPLGMKRTTLALPALMRSKDYALGYEYDEATKKTKRMPFRPESAMASVAPAGSVYSNASEMANWLRLMLAGGVFDGKRLVSEKNFGEIVAPQMKNISGAGADYGLGWFLINRKGRKIIQHGGSIDGFRAEVSMMPDEKLGFVILTNSYKTPLVASETSGGLAEEIVWSNLVDGSPVNNAPADSKNAAPKAAANNGGVQYKELSGTYETEVGGKKLVFQLVAQDGKLTVQRPGQRALTLVEKGKDTFSIAGAPAAYEINVKRSAAGEVSGLFMKEPKGSVELQRVDDFKSPLSTDELMSKVVNALGGEANLQKHKTSVTTYEINLVNQGVVGTGTISLKAPNLKSNRMTLSALGKRLGTINEYFNGTAGGTESSFLPAETKSGNELAQERIASDFYAPLNWHEAYKTIEIKGTTKVGDEEAYIVIKTPADDAPVTDYISTKNFLLLRSDTPRGITRYGDYRPVDGVMLPFRWTIESSGTGEQIITVKTSKFDVSIPDSVFTGGASRN